jgi:hypothetical protein
MLHKDEDGFLYLTYADTWRPDLGRSSGKQDDGLTAGSKASSKASSKAREAGDEAVASKMTASLQVVKLVVKLVVKPERRPDLERRSSGFTAAYSCVQQQ